MKYFIFYLLLCISFLFANNVTDTNITNTNLIADKVQDLNKTFVTAKEIEAIVNKKILENQGLFNANVDTLISGLNYGFLLIGVLLSLLSLLLNWNNNRVFKNREEILINKIDINRENLAETITEVKANIKSTIQSEMIYYISDNLKNIEKQSLIYANNKLDNLEKKSSKDAKKSIDKLTKEIGKALEIERRLLYNVDKHYSTTFQETSDFQDDFLRYITIQYTIKQIMQGDENEASMALDKLTNFKEIDYIIREYIKRIEKKLASFESESLNKKIKEYRNKLLNSAR